MAAAVRKIGILSAFWFSLCILGNVYQIAEITDLYMRYEMATTVSVDFPEEFIPPSSSFCFYSVDVVKWDKLFSIKPQLRSTLNGLETNFSSLEAKVRKMGHVEKMYFDRIVFANMTGAEIYSVLLDDSDIFSECGSVSNLVYQISVGWCKKKFKIRKFCFQLVVCFNFEKIKESSEWTSVLYNQMDLDRVTGIPGYMSEFKLKPSTLKRADMVTIVMSHPPEGNRGDQKKIFLTKLRHVFSVTYSDFENFFLPHPFATECIDYNATTEFISRDDCFDRCITQFSINRTNKIYSGPIIYPETEHEIIPTAVLMNNPSMIQLKRNASKYCSNQCRFKECNQHFYVPKLKSSNPFIYNSFIFQSMNDPKITTVYSQRLDLMQFMTDLASTIGFWVGTSIFSSIFEIVEIFNKFKQILFKHQTNKENERKFNEQKLYSLIEEKIKTEMALYMPKKIQDSIEAQLIWIEFVQRKQREKNQSMIGLE